MGGDVWNWCEDKFNDISDDRVLRGGSCYAVAKQHGVSSCRVGMPPDVRDYHNGFRVVLVVVSP